MTHHTGHHLIAWCLLLGVFCSTLPYLTADLNDACQSLAAGKFQIRAMTCPGRYCYLVSSEGQLFVENRAPILNGIQLDTPTIQLSKPAFNLSTDWYDFSGPVDYANATLQFGFTRGTSADSPILRVVTYVCLSLTDAKNCEFLNLLIYAGFQLKGREAPSRIEEKRSWIRIASGNKPVFWLNDHLSMYPILLKDAGTKMEITSDNKRVQEEALQVPNWDQNVPTHIGTFKEATMKPQSGLFNKDVLFIADQDSTGHFFSVDKGGNFLWGLSYTLRISEKTLGIEPKTLALSEVIKIPFCQIEPPAEAKVEPKVESKDEPALPIKEEDNALADLNKDAVKATTKAPNRKIRYFFAGIVLIVLAFAGYAVMVWWKTNPKKKSKKRDKSSKKRDKASKTANFWGTIKDFLAKVSPCTAKNKRKEILMSKARESVMLASMASAVSRAKQSARRRKKGSKVGPASRASRRSAVSGALSEMQKGLLAFKALMRQPKPKLKPFSMASTASTASRASKASLASLASLPAETQSLDYHF